MPSKNDPVPQMTEEVKQFVKALNRLVAIYTANPDLPVPYLSDMYAFVDTREEMSKTARQLARWRPNKRVADHWYMLEMELSAKHKLSFNINREKVCERVQVGTKLVEVAAQPAVEAHVEEQPQYEWKCPEAILSGGERS